MDDQPNEGVAPGDLDAMALANVTKAFWDLREEWAARTEWDKSVEAAYFVKWFELAYGAHRDVLDATLDFLLDGDA